MNVIDDPTHRLAHIGGVVCYNQMASLNLNPKLGADLVKSVNNVISGMPLCKVSRRHDEIVLLESLVDPMSWEMKV